MTDRIRIETAEQLKAVIRKTGAVIRDEPVPPSTVWPWRVWFTLVEGTIEVGDTLYHPGPIWIPAMQVFRFVEPITIEDIGAAESGWPPRGGPEPTPELAAKLRARGVQP